MTTSKLPAHHFNGVVTKFICPTNHRGSLISARSGSGKRVIVSWDNALDPYENHRKAAEALFYAMGQGRPAVECGPEWEFIGANAPEPDGYIWIAFEAPSRVHGCVRRNDKS